MLTRLRAVMRLAAVVWLASDAGRAALGPRAYLDDTLGLVDMRRRWVAVSIATHSELLEVITVDAAPRARWMSLGRRRWRRAGCGSAPVGAKMRPPWHHALRTGSARRSATWTTRGTRSPTARSSGPHSRRSRRRRKR